MHFSVWLWWWMLKSYSVLYKFNYRPHFALETLWCMYKYCQDYFAQHCLYLLFIIYYCLFIGCPLLFIFVLLATFIHCLFIVLFLVYWFCKCNVKISKGVWMGQAGVIHPYRLLLILLFVLSRFFYISLFFFSLHCCFLGFILHMKVLMN